MFRIRRRGERSIHNIAILDIYYIYSDYVYEYGTLLPLADPDSLRDKITHALREKYHYIGIYQTCVLVLYITYSIG